MNAWPTQGAGPIPGDGGGREDPAGACDVLDAYWDDLSRGETGDPDGWLRNHTAPSIGLGLADDLSTLKLLHRYRDELDAISSGGGAGLASTCDTPKAPDESAQVPAIPPDAAWLSAQQIHLISPLAAGGMGEVFLAWHGGLKREVVVKVARGPRYEARLRREVAILAKLGSHQHIASVRTAGDYGGHPCLVLEHVVGMDLRKLVKNRGHLPWPEACEYARQAALGLGHAHRRNVVHRDVKPANLILSDEDAAIRVIDWGLARDAAGDAPGDDGQTREGDVLGTLNYCAPEQMACPTAATARSDLYSLGCTLYELLSGHPPFMGPDLIRAHACDPVPPLRDVPPEVGQIVDKLMAKRPEDRYASTSELVEALDGVIARGSPRDKPFPPTPAFTRRRAILRAAPGLVVLTAAGFLAYHHERVLRMASRLKAAVSPAPSNQPSPVHAPSALAASMKGAVHVWIWQAQDSRRQRLSLLDPGALPLKAGDQIRIEAQANRPAYLYLIWIDAEGRAQPIYPWTPGQWDRAVETEERVEHLMLPRSDDRGWEIQSGPAGMETLLLLARESPLPPQVDLRTLLAGLPGPSIQDPRSLIWFDNWEPVRREADRDRGPSFFEIKIDDPILRTQALLRQRLAGHFAMMRAVSFANRGG